MSDIYLCEVCGHVYDPHKGDGESQTPPGTAFEDLKTDWTCPVCSASRRHFERIGPARSARLQGAF